MRDSRDGAAGAGAGLRLLGFALAFATAAAAFPGARADEYRIDVAALTACGTGQTNGWEVSGVDAYDDGGLRLNAQNDFVVSRLFPAVVTQVVMEIKSSASEPTRFLMLTPEVAFDAEAVFRAAPSKSADKYEQQTFVWSPFDEVRQFRLQIMAGSGTTWGIKSITVRTDPQHVLPPEEVTVESSWRDAARVTWKPAPRTTWHEISVSRIDRMPPTFDVIREWDFSSLTNASGNSKSFFEIDRPPALLGISGSNLNIPSYEGGFVQIGTGTKHGEMLLPATNVGGDGLVGRLKVWRYPLDESKALDVFALRGAETNELAHIDLPAEKTECSIPLPPSFAADWIVLRSGQNKKDGRVRVESFSVISDYTAGYLTTNLVETVERARRPDRVIYGLSPGDWLFSIRSFGNGSWSAHETSAVISLSPDGGHLPRRGLVFLVK